MDEYYPPSAFYFEVKVLGSQGSPASASQTDGSFQEISGIDRELEIQPLAEGGENRFTHQLPKRGRHPNLVLKRGLVSGKSALADWAEQTIGSQFTKPIQTKGLLVMLLSSDGEPVVVWDFDSAYPVKWTTSPFKSTDSSIVVESLEMAYASVARKTTRVGIGQSMLAGRKLAGR